jgi:methylenetetrahydrofolate dehydrogenase (NADP+) / methenyltetrahydrofolate cyclohydrolase
VRVDGRRVAETLLAPLAEEVRRRAGRPPCLATLVVDDAESSSRQAALKHRACERVGMTWRHRRLPARTTTEEAVGAVRDLGDDPGVDGLFVHLPLPPDVDAAATLSVVPLAKDIDGLRDGSPFPPASAQATLEVLRCHRVPLERSSVAVVGDTPLARGVARLITPLAAHLAVLATVESTSADVVVAAAGVPGSLRGTAVRAGAVVVDAASGDVDVESVEPVAGLLCATPGGIGPVTVACLLTATARVRWTS